MFHMDALLQNVFQFNTVAHNIILNGTETEQKYFVAYLWKMPIFLKILVDYLIFFLMEDSSLPIWLIWKISIKGKLLKGKIFLIKRV